MNISIAGIAVKNGKIFIARRVEGGDMGGKWEFPGGKAESGESCEESLVREFFEEFGVKITPDKLLGESSFTHKGIKRILYAYKIYLDDEYLNLTEHTEWKWASLEEIKNLDFIPSDLSLIPFIEPVLADS
ncbi:MAG: (deoxy)nucleoside triphosphate pyrophosphohydrolase [Spirochaetaceae bacterium]|jgi:8-oxo-dGTP diphosphatase|nr:(deoxy)nucleoside triphosphate pyrophosphohydrolase [Spirochaetaceae bacterium]